MFELFDRNSILFFWMMLGLGLGREVLYTSLLVFEKMLGVCSNPPAWSGGLRIPLFVIVAALLMPNLEYPRISLNILTNPCRTFWNDLYDSSRFGGDRSRDQPIHQFWS